MILFNTTAINQFTIIPRDYVSNAYMTIRDDSTNVTVDYTLVPRVAGVGNIEIDKRRPTMYIMIPIQI